MATEAMLQLGILILTLSLFFIMHNIHTQTTQARTRTRTRNKNHQSEPNRHLTKASRHLARARSASHRSQHAKNALTEADKALSVWPRDPRAHILRAQALCLMGHNAASIKSLSAALSSPAAKSLPASERAGALVKRAELKVVGNRRRRVDSAVEDLVEAVGLSGSDSAAAQCLLGKCYELKGMSEEAKDAFQKVLEVEPDSEEARSALQRLGLL